MEARTMAAARIDAAALCSLFRCFLCLFFCELLIVWTTSCWADNIYSRHELLKLGLQCEQAVTADFFHSHNIPKDIIRTPGSPWITIPTGRRRRRRRDRKQKRGCRAGVLAKLRKNPNKPPLPSIILANVRSLGNKMDELQLQVATNRIVKDCCVLIFTETWLHSSIPDAAIELAGHTAHRYDRSGDSGIVSLNHVRQVIQHDERNQEKLKKFMIRIGVFSCLYLLPLVTLLACYTYEQSHRSSWENTWINDRCQEYSIPCSYKTATPDRPDLSLFLVKYLMTLVVGISAVFWVSSKKTCSEWAYFFNRTRKRDPISESRRVLQESCEFFLKHNTRVQHKKKHYKSSSHKLKVISKSMGTSTGAAPTNAGTTSSSGNHETLLEGSLSDTLVREQMDRTTAARSSRRGEREGGERRSKGGSSSRISSHSESVHRAADGRITPGSELAEVRGGTGGPKQHPALNLLPSSAVQDSAHQLCEKTKDPKDI